MQSILNFSWGIWWSVLCNFEINKADINCKFIFHSYNKLDIVIAQPLLFCRHDGGGGITGVVSEGAGWLPRGQDQRHVLQLERRPGLLCPHTQIQASPHRLPQPRYQGLERVPYLGLLLSFHWNIYIVYWRNLELAFVTAEHCLGVAPLIEVEDVLFHDFPDQFSVMTYVAQFHNLFCKQLNGIIV